MTPFSSIWNVCNKILVYKLLFITQTPTQKPWHVVHLSLSRRHITSIGYYYLANCNWYAQQTHHQQSHIIYHIKYPLHIKLAKPILLCFNWTISSVDNTFHLHKFANKNQATNCKHTKLQKQMKMVDKKMQIESSKHKQSYNKI